MDDDMVNKDLCNCLDPKDKEDLLINLDENIRHEESNIIELQTRKEEILLSENIDLSEIENLDYLTELHYDEIGKIKGLRSIIERTTDCV
jgi:hypothetical protein